MNFESGAFVRSPARDKSPSRGQQSHNAMNRTISSLS